jgi:hypothetical protein
VATLSAKPTGFTKNQGLGFDTNNDTKQDVFEERAAEVIENMVGPWGLEPQTSTVSTYHGYKIQQLRAMRRTSFSVFYPYCR